MRFGKKVQRMSPSMDRTAASLTLDERQLWAVIDGAPIGSAQCCALEKVCFELKTMDAAHGKNGRAVASAEDLPRS